MPAKASLMGVGRPAAEAHLLGYDVMGNVASAGSTQGTATPLQGTCATITGTGGVKLPPAAASGPVLLLPTGASTVYPNGTDVINALGPGVGLLLSAGKAIKLEPVGAQWFALASAI